ncbi:hypothetical protein U7230_12475 [Carboxydochorda subterranea]|uniref:Uncharacterized protein n=1 Tax=Carboxydichorda subterranea TaxID=3109565 RepID=A0ABZ1BWA2_9FIRM|nr:hypothetical protein [Limnochorda sp. L945t]WRP16890.1 hypothetical protein U7230_12475 [Limnochorda sp. L945t]
MRSRRTGSVAAGLVVLVGVLLAVGWAGGARAAVTGVPLSQKIQRIYAAVTGKEPPAGTGLRDQVDAVTTLLYGADWQQKVSPSLVGRVDQLLQVVSLGDPNRSVFSKELAVEWTINQALYEWELASRNKSVDLPKSPAEPPLKSLQERVAWLETLLYGKEQPGGILDRVDRLGREVWGGTAPTPIQTKVVKIARNTGNVRVQLLGTLSNERGSASSVGQRVHFVVMDDLRVDGALVLPRGAVGIATVDEVESPSLGRAGKLSASGLVWAIDGTLLGATLGLDEAVSSGQGVSMVGAGLSGPVAAPTGLLVQGGARKLDPGTVLVASIGPAPGWKEAPVIDAVVL